MVNKIESREKVPLEVFMLKTTVGEVEWAVMGLGYK